MNFFQYLLEAGWASEGYLIGVTQPRRVAAITVILGFLEIEGGITVKKKSPVRNTRRLNNSL